MSCRGLLTGRNIQDGATARWDSTRSFCSRKGRPTSRLRVCGFWALRRSDRGRAGMRRTNRADDTERSLASRTLWMVEVGQPRLHHQHVCALGLVQPRLEHRLPRVGRVHLVLPPVTERRGASRRLAERAVEAAGVFHGVRQDGTFGVARGIEGSAHGRHHAVHHPARRHDVGPGVGVHLGRASPTSPRPCSRESRTGSPTGPRPPAPVPPRGQACRPPTAGTPRACCRWGGWTLSRGSRSTARSTGRAPAGAPGLSRGGRRSGGSGGDGWPETRAWSKPRRRVGRQAEGMSYKGMEKIVSFS